MISVVEMAGQTLWIARQIGAALGYADPGRLPNLVGQEWSTELVEHTDYLVLRGEALAALKAAAPGLVDPRAPSLLLLTESGVHLVALLSRQPAAARLRRWLASEVLPALRRSGAYAAPGHTPELPSPALPEPDDLPPPLLAVEGGALLELLRAEAHAGHPLPALRGALILRATPPAPPPASALPFETEADRALRTVVTWAHLHAPDFDDGHGLGAHGRWTRAEPWTELAIQVGQVRALLATSGHPVATTLRAWAARGWLVPGDGAHVGPKRQIGRRGVRCVVFTRAAVERVGAVQGSAA